MTKLVRLHQSGPKNPFKICPGGIRIGMHLERVQFVIPLADTPLKVGVTPLPGRSRVTTRGTRIYRNKRLEEDSAYKRYIDTLLGILRIPLSQSDDGGNHLLQRPLPLSSEAFKLWRKFHDCVELQLVPKGELERIKGLASKAAEHASRLAAIITLIENPLADEIPEEAMDNAISLMNHYVCESERIFEIPAIDAEVQDAELLGVWLVMKWAKKERGHSIDLRTIQQNVTPKRLRESKTHLEHLMSILEDHLWVRPEGEHWEISTWGT